MTKVKECPSCRMRDLDALDKFCRYCGERVHTVATVDPITKLTPALRERVEMLIEEHSEVIHVLCKVLRHGWTNHHPNSPEKSNHSLFVTENRQISTIERVMQQEGDFGAEYPSILPFDEIWRRKLKYTYHQQGVLLRRKAS